MSATPIATTFMFTEGLFFTGTPSPIAFVYDHMCVRRIGEMVVGMPADVIRTDDLRQRRPTIQRLPQRYKGSRKRFKISFGDHRPRRNRAGTFLF